MIVVLQKTLWNPGTQSIFHELNKYISNIYLLYIYIYRTSSKWETNRIQKILIYSQPHDRKRRVARPDLGYRDKLKKKLIALSIPIHTFIEVALLPRVSRAKYYKAIQNFDENYLQHLKVLREKATTTSVMPATSDDSSVCTICGLARKSAASLKCHVRHWQEK